MKVVDHEEALGRTSPGTPGEVCPGDPESTLKPFQSPLNQHSTTLVEYSS